MDYTTKICIRCKVEYPATSEYFHQINRGGSLVYCNPCIPCLRRAGELFYEDRAEPIQTEIYKRAHRLRAIKHNAEGSHTSADIRLAWKNQRGKCWWCGVQLIRSGKGRYHEDHRIALSRGGSDDPGNIVLACPTCNLRKQNMTPMEFAGRLL